MRIFAPELVEMAFKGVAGGVVNEKHEELVQGKFHSYDEFECHQFEKRKPFWINALMKVSGCRSREKLEEQWEGFAGNEATNLFAFVSKAAEGKLKGCVMACNANGCHFKTVR